jgi:hypothetical protein
MHIFVILSLAFASWVAGDQSADCAIDGDADILGIGVRLGVYFQLASSFVIAFVRPEEAIVAIPTTNMLMTGIFIALLHSMSQNTITSSELICALWMIVLDFPFVMPLLSVVGAQYFSCWSVGVILLRWSAFVGLNAWYWFSGLTTIEQCPPPRVFFFANLSAIGNIRTYFKITACLGIIYAFFGLVIFVRAIVSLSQKPATQSYKERWEVKISNWDILSAWDREEAEETDGPDLDSDNRLIALIVGVISNYSWGLYGVFMCILMFSCLSIWKKMKGRSFRFSIATILVCGFLVALSVMPVELQLYWNNIGGVDTITTSGQLIAFSIGAFSLVRAIWLSVMGDHGAEEGGTPEELPNNDAPRSSEAPADKLIGPTISVA